MRANNNNTMERESHSVGGFLLRDENRTSRKHNREQRGTKRREKKRVRDECKTDGELLSLSLSPQNIKSKQGEDANEP